MGRAGREGVAITLAEPREHRQMKNIERVTRHKFTMETVPSVAHLKERRMELTRDRLREAIMGGDGEPFRAVLESLSDEFDVVEVAMAAIQIAHEASAPEVDEQEIPSASMKGSGKKTRHERTDKPSARMKHSVRPDRGQRRSRSDDGDRTRLYVGAGRTNGIRPKDLVGAIAGEAGLAGSEIGPIEIQDRFSLVSVPADKADHVIRSMENVVMRGRRANVRRERF